MAWSTFLTLALAVVYVQAHGRLMQPPNRASLWRFGYDSPANYDDDGMNCGGFYTQYSVNGGKCGICGDAYDQPQPRAHELGGKYGQGYIVANYEPGQVITTNVYLSASHLGYWEFRICTDPHYQHQDCFDKGHLLELENGGTKFHPLKGDGSYTVNFRLPAGLTCEHCVLQWQYTAGNNWGRCADGKEALGCGNQEQFYSCADISIGTGSESNDIPDGDEEDTVPSTVKTTTTSTTTPVPTTVSVQSPLVTNMIQDFINLNPIALQMLLRGIDLSAYRIFTGNTPVTSNPQPHKKYTNKHRRKKNNKRKNKRRKKSNRQVLFWR